MARTRVNTTVLVPESGQSTVFYRVSFTSRCSIFWKTHKYQRFFCLNQDKKICPKNAMVWDLFEAAHSSSLERAYQALSSKMNTFYICTNYNRCIFHSLRICHFVSARCQTNGIGCFAIACFLHSYWNQISFSYAFPCQLPAQIFLEGIGVGHRPVGSACMYWYILVLIYHILY